MKTNLLKLACMLAIAGGVTSCSSDDSKSDDPPNTNCPQGYAGFDCSEQITPKKIIITKITVYNFPYLDNGVGWDSVIGSDPAEADIYISLSNSAGQPLDIGNSYYENASEEFAYEFTPPTLIELTSPNEILSLDLYDYDGENDAADHIGKTYFTCYSSTGGFPSTKYVENGQFIYQLSLQYAW